MSKSGDLSFPCNSSTSTFVNSSYFFVVENQTFQWTLSRWVMLEAGGGYLGSTLGAFAYDLLGFQWATVVESGVGVLLKTLRSSLSSR